MIKIEWENFRRADGSINLVAAYNSTQMDSINEVGHAIVVTQLVVLENLARIHSRQVAALAITQAVWAAEETKVDDECLYELSNRISNLEAATKPSPTVGAQSTR